MRAVEARSDDGAADGPWALAGAWVATKLEDIIERLTDRTHQAPKTASDGIPFVVIGIVGGDRIDWSTVSKWVSISTYLNEPKRLRPPTDEILYTAVGNAGLLRYEAFRTFSKSGCQALSCIKMRKRISSGRSSKRSTSPASMPFV